MTRVLIVPGAAVRSYVRPAADALRDRGVEVHLLAAPGEPGAPADLRDYGQALAHQLSRDNPVDLLVHSGDVGRLVRRSAASSVRR